MTSVSGKDVFISGPMTGNEHYNVGAFADAHALLKDLGAHRVYNPGIQYLLEPASESEQCTHEYYMRRSIHELTWGLYENGPARYDLVVLLPGWEESVGATEERAVAQWCGIPVVELGDVTA
ncbi:MAG: DUF4406 domain-containing protein [Atopobiaceae bacterium]|nr:DUF4406 domain-containing protein [Atopobiaceae bacterium]